MSVNSEQIQELSRSDANQRSLLKEVGTTIVGNTSGFVSYYMDAINNKTKSITPESRGSIIARSDLIAITFTLLNPNPFTMVYMFPMNPYKESRSYSKIIQFSLSNGGHFIQALGNDMVDFVFSSRTQELRPDTYVSAQGGSPDKKVPIAQVNIRDTTVYKQFQSFVTMYLYFNGGYESDRLPGIGTPSEVNLYLGYARETWKGALFGLKVDFDADNPWIINYNFSFKAFPQIVASKLPNFTQSYRE
jgi:hypothetical protein